MKLVNLTKPMAVPHQLHTYTELLQQIHDDLRIQHPEWVQPNGESPMCDSYEARLTELLLAARPFVDFQKRVDGNLEGKSSTKGQKS
jgi:hypothetical protein